MVKKYSITNKHIIRITIISAYHMGKNFRTTVWTLWIKRCGLPLWSFQDFAKHFTASSLIKFYRIILFFDNIEQSECAERIYVGSIFRDIKTHPHMALRSQIVNFIRLTFIDNSIYTIRIGQISVMKNQVAAINMRIF